ncbi:MAG: T9SS type A sorting domain-containing protein [Ignavibacteriaceae bacterium]|nr:T9SS type A sorting domain-containing protein [Ignavibacteriaceae bacterium]
MQWNVPNINSDQCLIKVSQSFNPTLFDISDSLFSIQYNPSYDFIAANEVLMWVGNNGDGSHDPRTDGSGFYWPGGINNTGESAIFEDGLCWGGKVNGQIRVNGNTHRQGLKQGNILPNGTPADYSDPKFRIYKIKKGWEYLPPSPERDKYEFNFLNWPAELGAPWIDENNDGIYTPGVDKPDYVGDEVLFYVANDLDTATTIFTYGSNPIGLEFQTTVYAFDREDLKDVVFKRYKIINKSINTCTDLFFSYWTDDDMGEGFDDYVGCDTMLNLGFTYNRGNNDGIYGTPPPAVGHMFLQTPKIPATINDSAYFDGKWIKSFKNTPLTSFTLYLGGVSTYRDPHFGTYSGTLEVYNNMIGAFWNGDNYIDPNTGVSTKFVLSGDPVAGYGWYEGSGWPGGPSSGDRRYLLTTAPITMAPADTQEVVIAIFMNKGTDRLNSLVLIKQDAAFYKNLYYNSFPVSVDENNSVQPDKFVLYQNYPNPFNPSTTIKYTIPKMVNSQRSMVNLKVYDLLGREITTLVNKELAAGSYEVEFNTNNLASGIYIYTLQYGSFTSSKKMQLIK